MQDGGFLAPEAWSTSFIDQIHPASATGRLPITRIPMGTRVVHVPRLSANIQINYAAENAALTANQAQFQQVSFTARKQAA
jgi:HK97 family phage major capsid protein